jgi:hypothetical protein
MGEDGRAVAFDMLIEPDAGRSLGHDRCERGTVEPHPRAIFPGNNPKAIVLLLRLTLASFATRNERGSGVAFSAARARSRASMGRGTRRLGFFRRNRSREPGVPRGFGRNVAFMRQQGNPTETP